MVRNRIFIGVGAWLLGAVTATGGSLLAVSQLGRGLVDTTNQQLTAGAINDALAREKAEQLMTPTPSLPRTGQPSPTAHAVHTVRPGARHHQISPAPSPAPASAPAPTLLASAGGTVLASCQPAGAYLVSWSPQQDFEAQNVIRGPAAIVSVRFGAPSQSLTMRVTCHGATPAVLLPGWGGGSGDDGGTGGDE